MKIPWYKQKTTWSGLGSVAVGGWLCAIGMASVGGPMISTGIASIFLRQGIEKLRP